MPRIIRIGEKMFNCYLVVGEEGTILVDTGPVNARDQIMEQIKVAQVPKINLILLTHGHNDHIGNAAYFSKAFNAPVAMHRGDEPLIFDGNAKELHSKGVLGWFIVTMSKRMNRIMNTEVFKVDHYLEDGSDLKSFGVDAVVKGLPGHTSGSIGLLVEGKDFIVGDAMMHMGKLTPSRLFEDQSQMLASVEKIKSSGASTVHMGHGSSISI